MSSVPLKTQSYKSKLIDIVEQNPDLWLVQRKAPSLKSKMWHAVGKELGISGFDARRKWQILRDQFRREVKRSRFQKNYKSRWVYYNRMLFLRGVLRLSDEQNANSDTDTDRKSPVDLSEMCEQNLVTQMPVTSKIQVRQDLAGEQPHLAEFSSSIGTAISSSSSTMTLCEDFGRVPQRGQQRPWHVGRNDDEDYHFVMSILPSLQCIQHPKKFRVRTEIMNVIARELEWSNEGNTRTKVSQFQVKLDGDGGEQSFFVEGEWE